jgi:hypothetical protein
MRLCAFTGGSFNNLKRCNQITGLVVECMPSRLDAPDHEGFIVFGKSAQDFGKFKGGFLLGKSFFPEWKK